jgi:hypothetical protein
MEIFILPHLESSFRDAQDKILNDFEVEEYELEDGVNYYTKHGHVKIKEICDRIKLIYKEFGGDIDDEDDEEEEENDEVDVDNENQNTNNINEDGETIITEQSSSTTNKKKINAAITHDQVVEMLEVIVTEMTRMTEQFVSQYVAMHGPPDNRAELEAFHMQYITLSEQVETAVTDRFGVTSLKFQKALQNYSSSSDIQQIILKLQQLNIMAMAEHGIDFSKFMQ